MLKGTNYEIHYALFSNLLLFSLKYFPQHPVLKHLNLCPSLNVTDCFTPISNSHQIYSPVCFNLYVSWQWKGTKDYEVNGSRLSFLIIPSQMKFWFVTVIPQYFNIASFSVNILAVFILWFYLFSLHSDYKTWTYA